MELDKLNFLHADAKDSPAVLANRREIARQLGYEGDDKTAVKTLIVYHDGKEAWRATADEDDDVHHYAPLVEAWRIYRRRDNKAGCEIPVDDVFLFALQEYVGEELWKDVTSGRSKQQSFMSAILAGQNENKAVTIGTTR